MNIQAMMKQAQKIQKEMMEAKGKLDEQEFESSNSFVTVKALGNKTIKEIKIDSEKLENDDIEMLQDLIVVVINDVMNQIEKETEKVMGKYTQGMPGLF